MKQPQDLVASVNLSSVTLSFQGRGVVSKVKKNVKMIKYLPSNLLIAEARRPGTNNIVITE